MKEKEVWRWGTWPEYHWERWAWKELIKVCKWVVVVVVVVRVLGAAGDDRVVLGGWFIGGPGGGGRA
jgi:hypothetical protein